MTTAEQSCVFRSRCMTKGLCLTDERLQFSASQQQKTQITIPHNLFLLAELSV